MGKEDLAGSEAKKPSYEDLEMRVEELEAREKGRASREYKSRLFAYIFGREENKRWTLELYNAINGTSYEDPSGIVIYTIEDVVYMGMKNDVSFIVSELINLFKVLNIYEQQSSFNPNVPVREFMYLGKMFDKYIYMSKLNRYGSKLIPLPIPKLVVLYNGERNQPEEMILRLEDAFKEEIRNALKKEMKGHSEFWHFLYTK